MNILTSPKPEMRMPLSSLVESEELFPTNSPELGTGASVSELGGVVELGGP